MLWSFRGGEVELETGKIWVLDYGARIIKLVVDQRRYLFVDRLSFAFELHAVVAWTMRCHSGRR